MNKLSPHFLLLDTFALFLLFHSPSPAPAQTTDAKAIVDAVSKNREVSGFEVRARIVTEDASGSKTDTKQIVIKRRHTDGRKLTLYQAYWPPAWKGHAVVIETQNDRLAGGYFFEPPNQVTRIDQGAIGNSILGSSLTVEGVSEFFWSWPNPKFIERTQLGKSQCAVIEFRAPQESQSKTKMVRAWVDEKVNLPVRIEKYDASGKAISRVHVERLTRTSEGEWAPSKLLIESLQTGKQTHLIPSRGKHNISISEDEFTIEALKKVRSLGSKTKP